MQYKVRKPNTGCIANSYINSITFWSLLIYFGYWNIISEYITDENPKVKNKSHMIFIFLFFTVPCLGLLVGILLNLSYIIIQFAVGSINQDILSLTPFFVYYISVLLIFSATLYTHFPGLIVLAFSDKNLKEFWSDPKLVKSFYNRKKESLS